MFSHVLQQPHKQAYFREKIEIDMSDPLFVSDPEEDLKRELEREKIQEQVSQFKESIRNEIKKENSLYGVWKDNSQTNYLRIFLFTLLQRMEQISMNTFLFVKKGRLFQEGIDQPILFSPIFSPKDLESRINLLCNRLGIPGASSCILESDWIYEFWETEKISKKQLLKIGRLSIPKASQLAKSPLEKWRKALDNRIISEGISVAFTEGVDYTLPKVKEEKEKNLDSYLDSGPLFQDWPERLLEDPAWASLESPFPELKNLPLDDVWVDLNVINLQDTKVKRWGENFLEALEQRYDDWLWKQESTEFLLETLQGKTAIIGSPGCGKTTFLKWMARKLIQMPSTPYLLPLFVPLRKYVLAARQNSDLNFVRFSIMEIGVHNKKQLDKWERLLPKISGPERKIVLFLLDGWDEVPVEDRPWVQNGIDTLSYGYSVVISSRPSAYPMDLGASRYYQITDLSPEGSYSLIQRWFASIGSPEIAPVALQHLDAHPDLKKLARNPFLLTIYCGITYRQTQEQNQLSIPKNRTELYRIALDWIYYYHNRLARGERRDLLSFREEEKKQLEHFALWLEEDAPNAPIYLFDREVVLNQIGNSNFFEKLLLPSRLLNQWDQENNSYHFLHTTFQEYLAASALKEISDPKEFEKRLFRHLYDESRQEVYRFLAGQDSHLHPVFWNYLKKVAQKPDRFGRIFIRLARFLTELQPQDGGLSLLGVDVREKLWKQIQTNASIYSEYIETFIEFDLEDFEQRIQAALQEKRKDSESYHLLRISRHIQGQSNTGILVEKVITGDEKKAAVAAFSLEKTANSLDRKRLKDALKNGETSPVNQKYIVRTLGNIRDFESIEILSSLYISSPVLREEIALALGNIGGFQSLGKLRSFLKHSEDLEEEKFCIRGIGRIRHPEARNFLLEEMALRSSNDPLLEELLSSLLEFPIPHNADLLVPLLENHPSSVIRSRAASCLEFSPLGYVEVLARVGREDPQFDVRLSALEALEKRGRPVDAKWLEEKIRNGELEPEEREGALKVYLRLTSNYALQTDGLWLRKSARKILIDLLNEETNARGLSCFAAMNAYLLGEEIAPILAKLLSQDEFVAKEEVCLSLKELRHIPASEKLLQFVLKHPDIPDGKPRTSMDEGERLARAAAEALAHTQIGLLLNVRGKTAENALSQYSRETGALIFEDRVLNRNGKEIASL